MPTPAAAQATAEWSPLSAFTDLALASTGLHPDDVAAIVAEKAPMLGLANATIYLADLEQRFLVRLDGPLGPSSEPLAIDGTVAGRAYRTERLVVGSPEGGLGAGPSTTLWTPLMDSAERLGVISVEVGAGMELDDELLTRLQAFANLVAELISNKSAYGDVILRTKRTQEVTVAAEMRWGMLPPLTFAGPNLTISGILEPAYSVAGDTFDYAVNGNLVHVAIIDAVGHGLEAARIANLAVVSYRHSRRGDLGLEQTYRAMDHALADQFGSEKFATAQLVTLSLANGHLRWLNAGHPPPMVIRRRHRVDLVSEVCLPIGLSAAGASVEPVVAEAHLEPGDLVLFFTDGVIEARSASGEEFGRDRLADLVERAAGAAQTTAETLRLLGHAVLDHQIGVLQDDATLLLLAWDGPPPPEPTGPAKSQLVDSLG